MAFFLNKSWLSNSQRMNGFLVQYVYMVICIKFYRRGIGISLLENCRVRWGKPVVATVLNMAEFALIWFGGVRTSQPSLPQRPTRRKGNNLTSTVYAQRWQRPAHSAWHRFYLDKYGETLKIVSYNFFNSLCPLKCEIFRIFLA